MKMVPISSIADVTAGQGAPKPDEFSDSGIPFVRAGSLEGLLAGKSETDLELVPTETAMKRKLKLYSKGSILFAKSGMSATKNRIYVLQNHAYVVSHLAILKTKDNINRDYLRLALKQFPPSSLIKDLAYPAIGLGEIQGYEIPVPEEIDDQKRIAHLLGKVEALIARRKQHMQQLDELLKSVFLKMFGDPVRNERGWEISSLKYLTTKVGSGATPSGGNESYKIEGISLIRSMNIHDAEFLFKDLAYIDEIQAQKLRNVVVEEEDVLLNITGASVCRCAIVPKSVLPARVNQHVAIIRTKKKLLNPKYLAALLITPSYKHQLLKIARKNGATREALTKDQIEKLGIPFPPSDLQNQFATIVEKVESIKSSYQKSLTDFETLYGAVSQKAFKGELDLSRVPRLAECTEKENLEETDMDTIQSAEPLFEFPVSADLAGMQSSENRKELLSVWLTAWLEHLGETPFSAQNFMEVAKQRLFELVQDDIQGWGVGAYDELKLLVFKALEDGHLIQTYNDANNIVQIKTVQT